MGFSEVQLMAINHNTGPCMVIAGPGSGKTTVLTRRVRSLIDNYGVEPSSILVITFTKAAAIEMQNRFLSLKPDCLNSGQQGVSVRFGTFHSVYFSILMHAYNLNANCIVKSEMQMEFVREWLRRLSLEYDDEQEMIGAILSEISKVKGEHINIQEYIARSCPPNSFRKIFTSYEIWMRKKRYLDFDDMILLCFELFDQRKDILNAWQEKYKYILIDEFQDINQLQFDVIKMLADKYKNLFIVGDDDQSIYGFRGSKPSIMLKFMEIYPGAKRIDMTVNYRSYNSIVKASESLIDNNKERYKKNISANNPAIAKIKIIEVDKIDDEKKIVINLARQEMLKEGSFAVLSRTNAINNIYYKTLNNMGIECVSAGKKEFFYDNWVVLDILAYIELALGSRERSRLIRIINKPVRYISRNIIETPIDFDRMLKHYSYSYEISKSIRNLLSDLELIKSMTSFAAVNYIRKSIGYEDYIRNYAYEHKTDPAIFTDILDEVTFQAKENPDKSLWLDKIEKMRHQMQDSQNESADEKMRHKFNHNTSEGKDTKDDSKKKVNLLTMHSCKGLEFDTVVITDANEGICPYSKQLLNNEIEEERRLFYVAMTRAKRDLYIIYAKNRYNKKTAMSRFIEEIDRNHLEFIKYDTDK